MEFLHGHHTGEDEGVWPLVRERNPAAGALLDSLEADHGRDRPGGNDGHRCRAAVRGDHDDGPRAKLVAALDALTTVLLPHLDREVEEAMPVVSASITQAEWRAVERTYFIKPKSFARLGMEAHWLLDGIDREGYQIVVHTVPAVPRFILLHGFARAYRRRARARWQPGIPGAAGRCALMATDQARARSASLPVTPARTAGRRDPGEAVSRRGRRAVGTRGWAATGMRDVARGAGVPVETVYAGFRSKSDLLKAVIDLTAVGDTAPVPLDERPEFTALGSGTRQQQTRACRPARHRAFTTATPAYFSHCGRPRRRTGELARAAARGGSSCRRIDVEQGVSLITGRAVKREECDGLWAVFAVEVYQLLTGLRGWTPQQYETWLADVIDRLLRDPGQRT